MHANSAARLLFARAFPEGSHAGIPESLQSLLVANLPGIHTGNQLEVVWSEAGQESVTIHATAAGQDLVVWFSRAGVPHSTAALSAGTWHAFLSDASLRIHGSADAESTLETIASTAVPALADWCTIDLLDARDQFLRRAVVWHADREKAAEVAQMRRRYPVTRDDHHPVMSVVTDGEPVLIHSFDNANVQRMTRDDAHYQFIQSLGMRSSMIHPLAVDGNVLGAITFASAESKRLYTEADMERAAGYARHAALALSNILRYQKADEVSRIREHYLSVASHEIRTPLAVVSGFAALLIRQFETGTPDQERVETLLGELRQGVDRLESLTEDLLVASSVERERKSLEFEEVDLVELASEVIQRVRVANPDLNGNIRLTGESEVLGHWSPSLLDRALSNLIGNAVKYSADEVDVRVAVRKTSPHNASVEVSDAGIGVSETDYDLLFMPFMRGSVARRMSDGTGLGLYITRKIVDRHGGTIDVDSTPGRGSTFTVNLPLRPYGA